jgi:small subunit ribosomal protein S8
MNDPIADLITRIRNAVLVRKKYVTVPSSKLKLSILSVLKNEGFIDTFEVTEQVSKHSSLVKKQINIRLRYSEEGTPAINQIDRVSKGGRRSYLKNEKMFRYKSGLGAYILSTSSGIMTDRDAKRMGIGGEVLFKLF